MTSHIDHRARFAKLVRGGCLCVGLLCVAGAVAVASWGPVIIAGLVGIYARLHRQDAQRPSIVILRNFGDDRASVEDRDHQGNIDFDLLTMHIRPLLECFGRSIGLRNYRIAPRLLERAAGPELSWSGWGAAAPTDGDAWREAVDGFLEHACLALMMVRDGGPHIDWELGRCAERKVPIVVISAGDSEAQADGDVLQLKLTPGAELQTLRPVAEATLRAVGPITQRRGRCVVDLLRGGGAYSLRHGLMAAWARLVPAPSTWETIPDVQTEQTRCRRCPRPSILVCDGCGARWCNGCHRRHGKVGVLRGTCADCGKYRVRFA